MILISLWVTAIAAVIFWPPVTRIRSVTASVPLSNVDAGALPTESAGYSETVVPLNGQRWVSVAGGTNVNVTL